MANYLTHEREYRSEDLMEKIRDFHFVVCGLGAIGSNLTMSLARQGAQNFTLIDYDNVEESNLGTQAYTRQYIGMDKATALSNMLWDDLEIEAKASPHGIGERRIPALETGDLILDCLDNRESRLLIKGKRDNTLHIGLTENYGEVVWDSKYRVPQDQVDGDVCEYPLARNVVVLTAGIAAEVIMQFLDSGQQNSYCLTLRDLQISKL